MSWFADRRAAPELRSRHSDGFDLKQSLRDFREQLKVYLREQGRAPRPTLIERPRALWRALFVASLATVVAAGCHSADDGSTEMGNPPSTVTSPVAVNLYPDGSPQDGVRLFLPIEAVGSYTLTAPAPVALDTGSAGMTLYAAAVRSRRSQCHRRSHGAHPHRAAHPACHSASRNELGRLRVCGDWCDLRHGPPRAAPGGASCFRCIRRARAST